MSNPASAAVRAALRGVRRALREFLGVPLAVVAGFVALGAAAYAVDAAYFPVGAPDPPLPWLAHTLGDSGAIASLLGTVATGMITVTSITFSLLLIAVQQSASTLTNHVFDQFIRRWSNKFNFGFFVGLSIYLLITLATTGQTHRPVLGTALALLLSGVALCMVVILIYATIDQMRPYTIVRAIHAHTAAAHRAHRALLARTKRRPGPGLGGRTVLRAGGFGVVGRIDLDRIARVLEAAAREAGTGRIEVEVLRTVGARLAYRDPLLRLLSARPLPADLCDRIGPDLLDAVALEPRRTLDDDPGYGIQQLFAIGWTTTSTAKQNPQPGILACHALRDLIARWIHAEPPGEDPAAPVIYADDPVREAIEALESLAVVTSEGMQDRVLAEIAQSLAGLIADAPAPLLPTLERVALTALSGLGDHVLTGALEAGLRAAEAALRERGRTQAADAVREAIADLARSVGRLNSRSTRVPGG